MPTSCRACGSPFVAGRSTQVYCSTDCRTAARRKERKGKQPQSNGLAVLPASQSVTDGPVTAATIAEFTAVERLSTADAQLALDLARQIDAGGESGAGKSALAREFRAVKNAVLASAPQRGDAVDELERRRKAKAAGA